MTLPLLLHLSVPWPSSVEEIKNDSSEEHKTVPALGFSADKTRYHDVTCRRLLSVNDDKKEGDPPTLKPPLIDYYSTFKSCKWPISRLSAPFI